MKEWFHVRHIQSYSDRLPMVTRCAATLVLGRPFQAIPRPGFFGVATGLQKLRAMDIEQKKWWQVRRHSDPKRFACVLPWCSWRINGRSVFVSFTRYWGERMGMVVANWDRVSYSLAEAMQVHIRCGMQPRQLHHIRNKMWISLFDLSGVFRICLASS